MKKLCQRKAVLQTTPPVKVYSAGLKNEMFYGIDWKDVTIDEFIQILNDYLVWYNEDRIKQSLNYLSPTDYRKRLGLAC